MRNSLLSLVVLGMLFSCAGSNTGNPDSAQALPSSQYERVGSSVSPRSELEFTDTYAGQQSPRMANMDTTVLEPMRSIMSRPAPDASSTDAYNVGDAYDNSPASLDR